MKDDEAYEFYDDPENRKPTGPPVKRRSAKSEMVPVRMTRADLESIREAARSEGTSVSGWIRQAVADRMAAADSDAVLESSDDDQMPSHRVFVSYANPTAAVRPTITLAPERALRTQLVLAGSRLVDGFEREFERLRDAMTHEHLSSVFEPWVVFDDGHFRQRRSRRFDTDLATSVAKTLAETQNAIALVVRLTELEETVSTSEAIGELRHRISLLLDSIDEIEHVLLDTPKDDLSDIGNVGVVGFYRYADVVRDSLRFVDEELFLQRHALAELEGASPTSPLPPSG